MDKRVHTFPKGICPKMNVTAQLEFELAYYDSALQRFNYYTPLFICLMSHQFLMDYLMPRFDSLVNVWS